MHGSVLSSRRFLFVVFLLLVALLFTAPRSHAQCAETQFQNYTGGGEVVCPCFVANEQAGAIGVMISLVLAALGGCWWPLEIVPAGMRAVAHALPTGQAMSAIGEMLAVGPSAPFPAVNIAVLLLMAAIALPIAARRMRSQLVQ